MIKPQVVVFDLDGTLISVNSFQEWVRFLVRFAVFRSPRLLLGLGLAFARRALRRSDRVMMKRDILHVAETYAPKYLREEFSRRLLRHLYPEAVRELRRWLAEPDCQVFICTAAPADYVVPLALALGVEHVVATPATVDQGWQENFGEQKWWTLRKAVGRDDLVIAALYSDDQYDLPLMQRAQQVFLVHPKQACLEAVRAAGVPLSVVLGKVRAQQTPRKIKI